MPAYTTLAQLEQTLRALFARVQDQGPQALESLVQSKMIIRLNISLAAAPSNSPEAVSAGGLKAQPAMAIVVINGRMQVPQVSFGKSLLRPDLEVDLSSESLHRILTGELRLSKALAQGLMRVRGNVLKSKVLEDILHLGQAVYPQVLADLDQGKKVS